MIKTKEELLKAANELIGDREDVSILEDISDTLDSLVVTDPWEDRYNSLVKEHDDLKAKYRARFLDVVTPDPEDVTIDNHVEGKRSFEDLFEVKEDI